MAKKASRNHASWPAAYHNLIDGLLVILFIIAALLSSILASRAPGRVIYEKQLKRCQEAKCNLHGQFSMRTSLEDCLERWCERESDWANSSCSGSNALKLFGWNPKYNKQFLRHNYPYDSSSYSTAWSAAGILLFALALQAIRHGRRLRNALQLGEHQAHFPFTPLLCLCGGLAWLLLMASLGLAIGGAALATHPWGLYNVPAGMWTSVAVLATASMLCFIASEISHRKKRSLRMRVMSSTGDSMDEEELKNDDSAHSAHHGGPAAPQLLQAEGLPVLLPGQSSCLSLAPVPTSGAASPAPDLSQCPLSMAHAQEVQHPGLPPQHELYQLSRATYYSIATNSPDRAQAAVSSGVDAHPAARQRQGCSGGLPPRPPQPPHMPRGTSAWSRGRLSFFEDNTPDARRSFPASTYAHHPAVTLRKGPRYSDPAEPALMREALEVSPFYQTETAVARLPPLAPRSFPHPTSHPAFASQRPHWAVRNLSRSAGMRPSVTCKEKSGEVNCEELGIGSAGLEAGQEFSEKELLEATFEFAAGNLLGRGVAGEVYRGVLGCGRLLAVKRIRHANAEQALKADLEAISQLCHPNLAKLLGHCVTTSEQLLAYEYLPGGSLADHFSGSRGPPLEWPTKVKIAIGTARGLTYLHEGGPQPVLHGNFKASNILLDANYGAKLADYGLVRSLGDVTARGLGELGYLAPECAEGGALTEKGDVYSFGVVMLEFLTGRTPNSSIVEWARRIYTEHGDPAMMAAGWTCSEHEMCQWWDVALLCVRHLASERPSMRQVVDKLVTAKTLRGTSLAHPSYSCHLASLSSELGPWSGSLGGHCYSGSTYEHQLPLMHGVSGRQESPSCISSSTPPGSSTCASPFRKFSTPLAAADPAQACPAESAEKTAQLNDVDRCENGGGGESEAWSHLGSYSAASCPDRNRARREPTRAHSEALPMRGYGRTNWHVNGHPEYGAMNGIGCHGGRDGRSMSSSDDELHSFQVASLEGSSGGAARSTASWDYASAAVPLRRWSRIASRSSTFSPVTSRSHSHSHSHSHSQSSSHSHSGGNRREGSPLLSASPPREAAAAAATDEDPSASVRVEEGSELSPWDTQSEDDWPREREIVTRYVQRLYSRLMTRARSVRLPDPPGNGDNDGDGSGGDSAGSSQVEGPWGPPQRSACVGASSLQPPATVLAGEANPIRFVRSEEGTWKLDLGGAAGDQMGEFVAQYMESQEYEVVVATLDVERRRGRYPAMPGAASSSWHDVAQYDEHADANV